MLQILPIWKLLSSQMLADRTLLACRLMSEFQGDIESRGGSVALNSSAVSGGVSGMSHFGHLLLDTVSVNAWKFTSGRLLCTSCKDMRKQCAGCTALRLGASLGFRRQLRLEHVQVKG